MSSLICENADGEPQLTFELLRENVAHRYYQESVLRTIFGQQCWIFELLVTSKYWPVTFIVISSAFLSNQSITAT